MQKEGGPRLWEDGLNNLGTQNDLNISECKILRLLEPLFSRMPLVCSFPMVPVEEEEPRSLPKNECVINTTLVHPLHKKISFPLRISSVNVTKSAGNCGFGHIY